MVGRTTLFGLLIFVHNIVIYTESVNAGLPCLRVIIQFKAYRKYL